MYHLLVITPEKIVFDDKVIALIAPGQTGYLGILTDHTPLITALKTGIVTITNVNHEKHFYKISGGFLEVNRNQAFLLVDTIQQTVSSFNVD